MVVGLGHAFRTAPPVGNFRFVDFVAPGVRRRQARSKAHRAIDVDHAAADPTDQMMVVVSDAGLEASRRAGRLNAPDDAFTDQDAERVVHRLERDGPNLGPDGLGHGVGGDVGLTRDCPQDRQSLGRHLDTALPKEISRRSGHAS